MPKYSQMWRKGGRCALYNVHELRPGAMSSRNITSEKYYMKGVTDFVRSIPQDSLRSFRSVNGVPTSCTNTCGVFGLIGHINISWHMGTCMPLVLKYLEKRQTQLGVLSVITNPHCDHYHQSCAIDIWRFPKLRHFSWMGINIQQWVVSADLTFLRQALGKVGDQLTQLQLGADHRSSSSSRYSYNKYNIPIGGILGLISDVARSTFPKLQHLTLNRLDLDPETEYHQLLYLENLQSLNLTNCSGWDKFLAAWKESQRMIGLKHLEIAFPAHKQTRLFDYLQVLQGFLGCFSGLESLYLVSPDLNAQPVIQFVFPPAVRTHARSLQEYAYKANLWTADTRLYKIRRHILDGIGCPSAKGVCFPLQLEIMVRLGRANDGAEDIPNYLSETCINETTGVFTILPTRTHPNHRQLPRLAPQHLNPAPLLNKRTREHTRTNILRQENPRLVPHQALNPNQLHPSAQHPLSHLFLLKTPRQHHHETKTKPQQPGLVHPPRGCKTLRGLAVLRVWNTIRSSPGSGMFFSAGERGCACGFVSAGEGWRCEW